MNTAPPSGPAYRAFVRSSGAIAAVLAILLNVVLPLAVAPGARAGDAIDLAMAICHGGAAGPVESDPARTPAPSGPYGHDCCAACLPPLSHALVPPVAEGPRAIAAPSVILGAHRDDTIALRTAVASFRPRAPPAA